MMYSSLYSLHTTTSYGNLSSSSLSVSKNSNTKKRQNFNSFLSNWSFCSTKSIESKANTASNRITAMGNQSSKLESSLPCYKSSVYYLNQNDPRHYHLKDNDYHSFNRDRFLADDIYEEYDDCNENDLDKKNYLSDEQKINQNKFHYRRFKNCQVERKYPLNYSGSTSSTISSCSSSGYSGSDSGFGVRSGDIQSSASSSSISGNESRRNANTSQMRNQLTKESNISSRLGEYHPPPIYIKKYTSTRFSSNSTLIPVSIESSSNYSSNLKSTSRILAPNNHSTNHYYSNRSINKSYDLNPLTTSYSTSKIRSLNDDTYETSSFVNNRSIHQRRYLRYQTTNYSLRGNDSIDIYNQKQIPIYIESSNSGAITKSSRSIYRQPTKSNFPTVTPYRSYIVQKKSISRNYTRVFDSGFDHNDSVGIA